ncbi:MAG: glycosyltransferase family 4 protein [Myxococcales bacterium]|nr:glycosyltransferase family 4 protein [Myxococcales bacterium]
MARLCFLSASPVPSTAANAVHTIRSCEAFARAGWDVTLVCVAGDERLCPSSDWYDYYGVEPRFAIRRVARPALPVAGQLLYTAGALWAARASCDVVYARDRLAAALLPRRTRLVYEAHQLPHGVRDRIERVMHARSDLVRVVAVSQALARDYSAQYPAVASRVLVAHCAAAGDLAPQPEPRGERLRVGYVGHLYDGKGAELVMQLAQRCPEMDFVVVGGEAAHVSRLAARAPAAANLTLHGPLPPSAVPEALASCNVLLAPYGARVCARDGSEIGRWMSPLKIAEYMAAGRAIVSSDLPPLRELLTDERDALLVAPDALERWVAALRRLLQPELRAALGAAARRGFEQRLTMRARAAAVLSGL